ncbi:hypothetical protein PBF_20193 [Cytobacillus firmus DS1]|uniref:Uncharacterized protein n=1 Tax=Cytobacillus firmus DS1 TaxID=1307436 RepID=W7LB83_CYTFI|nr:hypothetical protein PBF_20193 [Cytobacillus firmus DS1]
MVSFNACYPEHNLLSNYLKLANNGGFFHYIRNYIILNDGNISVEGCLHLASAPTPRGVGVCTKEKLPWMFFAGTIFFACSEGASAFDKSRAEIEKQSREEDFK